MGQTPNKLLLVVMAKAPVPGKVKTRLSPPFTPQEAVALYKCFLQDRIREMGRLSGIDLAVAYTPSDARDTFVRISGNGFQLFAQQGVNLGQRLSNIFIDKLEQDYSAVSIIDSDTPDLPCAIIEQAFQILLAGGTDAVFGPCDDGGYYLVGMRRPYPKLFEDIPWSTAAVLETTLSRAGELGIRTKLLPVWNDLDTFGDLVDYYTRNKRQLPDQHWPGKITFGYVSRIESITQQRDHINSST